MQKYKLTLGRHPIADFHAQTRSGQRMKIVDNILTILLIQILHIENVNCIRKVSTQRKHNRLFTHCTNKNYNRLK